MIPILFDDQPFPNLHRLFTAEAMRIHPERLPEIRRQREAINTRLEALKLSAITPEEAKEQGATRITGRYQLRQCAQREMLVRLVDVDFRGQTVLLVKYTTGIEVTGIEVWRAVKA